MVTLLIDALADGTLRFESAPLAAGRMTADGVQYHITDHLGSVRAVIDGSTGDILEASEYSSYGGRTELTSTVPSPLDGRLEEYYYLEYSQS